MSYAYLVPSWFYGYDVVLELMFAIISLLVALIAFKIYKKISQNSVKLFAISFIFISVSYLLQSILNFLTISTLRNNMGAMAKMHSILFFNNIGLWIHFFLMTLGLATLLYTTLKIKKPRVIWLLIILSVLGIYQSANALSMFYLTSTIYLLFITKHYISNFLKNRQTNTILIAVAFLLLLFSHLHFLLSLNHMLFYAVGHILELFAYVLILVNLYQVFKK